MQWVKVIAASEMLIRQKIKGDNPCSSSRLKCLIRDLINEQKFYAYSVEQWCNERCKWPGKLNRKNEKSIWSHWRSFKWLILLGNFQKSFLLEILLASSITTLWILWTLPLGLHLHIILQLYGSHKLLRSICVDKTRLGRCPLAVISKRNIVMIWILVCVKFCECMRSWC